MRYCWLNVIKREGLKEILRRNFVTNISGSKSIAVVVTSLRVDRVLATGLAVGRRKVEYSLLSGCVKLNGETVTKKSIELKEGDIVDRISAEKTSDTDYTLGRVILEEVGEKTKKGNRKVTLLRTKILVIPKTEYKSSFD